MNILTALILCRFSGLSTFAMQQTGIMEIDDNPMYDMMNNPQINWRSIVFGFALQFLKCAQANGRDNQGPKCFIIDDTPIEKTGKTIEFISRIHHHTDNRYTLGYKMLNMAYHDGKSLIPLDFSLLRESKNNRFGLTGKEHKKGFHKEREANTPGAVRASEIDADKIGLAVDMLQRANRHKLAASYVLIDSWFMTDGFIQSVRKINKGKMHVIGTCKMDKRKFLFEGQELNSQAIIKKVSTRKGAIHRSRTCKSAYMAVKAEYKGTPVLLFYIKYHKAKDWTLLLTTDLSLSFVQAMKLYQIRWSIEAMFKECKQYLRLGKAQNTDFDGQIADASLTLITHIILSLQRRFQAYETMGGLFRDTQSQLMELPLYERMWLAILKIMEHLLLICCIDATQLMGQLMADDQQAQKIMFLLNALDQRSTISTGNKSVA